MYQMDVAPWNFRLKCTLISCIGQWEYNRVLTLCDQSIAQFNFDYTTHLGFNEEVNLSLENLLDQKNSFSSTVLIKKLKKT